MPGCPAACSGYFCAYGFVCVGEGVDVCVCGRDAESLLVMLLL